MLPMTSPAQLSRVLLVADRPAQSATPTKAKIRRYRLARLQLEARDARFAHLRRAYD